MAEHTLAKRRTVIPLKSEPAHPVALSRRQNIGRSDGRPLNQNTRMLMESRLNHDFGRVLVHTGTEATLSARAMGARAFTVDTDVYFARGQYAPNTAAGRRLLAHELTHVVQQGQNAPATAHLGTVHVGSASSESEQEARQVSAHVFTGESTPVTSSVPAGTIQRDNGAGTGGSTGGEDEEYRLRWPGVQQGLFGRPWLGTGLELQLDPGIQAQIAAIGMMQRLLNPDSIRASLLRIDFDTLLATQPRPGSRRRRDLHRLRSCPGAQSHPPRVPAAVAMCYVPCSGFRRLIRR